MITRTTFTPLAGGWYRCNQDRRIRVKRGALEAVRRHRSNSGRLAGEREKLQAESAGLRLRVQQLIGRSGRSGEQPYIGHAPSAWEAMVRR
ncbi:hypothetical protein FJY94_00275 [Candidatus Kaiserbacteria bacterium]|nr:hypothetical protein [Candidatus Kaiserbacteria bacterium]